MEESRFDEAYKREGLLFGDVPSKILHDFLRLHPFTGTALDLGCGDGRDIIPLLMLGFVVTGVDRSATAIEKLLSRQELTQETVHMLTTSVADVRIWNWPSETFDLIIATTLLDHLALEEIPHIAEHMVAAAKDNALLFVEVHTIDDPGVTGKGPISEFSSEIKHYFGWNELLDIFRPYVHVLRYEDKTEWDYDHGEPHMHGFASLLGRIMRREN